ncbi:NUDIX domain-containing protein [[Eubacterium] cellulosolvens]
MLSPHVKLWLKKGKHSVLGAGRARLLHAIDEHGSITKAATAMGMSYRHAWGIIRDIQEAMGEEIIKTTRGGAHGGGALLTKRGKQIMKQFDETDREIMKLIKYGPRPWLTVDAVVFDGKGNIILIRRKNPPFQGELALPGGFVDNYETTEDAVRREVKEELGIDTRIICMVGVYSEPTRDPRQHTISVVYEVEPLSTKFKASDDAKAFERVAIKDFSSIGALAFDHDKIIRDAIKLNTSDFKKRNR